MRAMSVADDGIFWPDQRTDLQRWSRCIALDDIHGFRIPVRDDIGMRNCSRKKHDSACCEQPFHCSLPEI